MIKLSIFYTVRITVIGSFRPLRVRTRLFSFHPNFDASIISLSSATSEVSKTSQNTEYFHNTVFIQFNICSDFSQTQGTTY